jgi:microcystin degradation protein MlrC
VVLADAESVQAADRAGVGQRLTLRVGGKSDGLHGTPLEALFQVVHLCAGKWDEPQPRHGGWTSFDQGRTALVKADSGLSVLLTTRRMAPFSLRQLTSCGVEAAKYRFLVAKGVHAQVAAYQEVCKHFVRVDTPGVTSADMRRLEYRQRRRPLYPFELDASWK